MNPSYAGKLLAYNRHTSDPYLYADPFALATSEPWRTKLPMHRKGLKGMSFHRAAIAAMDHDAVNAGLWALAAFDPALVHFAELREHLRRLPEDHNSRVSLDRALSIYLEGQHHELLRGAGITTVDAAIMIVQIIGEDANAVAAQVLDCTDSPLAIELFSYAQYLGVLTAHGTAPWKRFAAVMADCHAHLEAKA